MDLATPPKHEQHGDVVRAGRLGWRAHLDLRFAPDGRGRVVLERRHEGPLVVQRPFFPEGPALPHVYVVHPPGGLVGGDRLGVAATVATGAGALLTTPAAGKLYRCLTPDAQAYQSVDLTVERGASLEWLPSETIAFEGAYATLSTRVDLAAGAGFLGWDILVLGRPACGEGFARGRVRQRLEIFRSGKPLLIERACWQDGPLLQQHFGLGGRAAVGTFVATAPPEVADQARAVLTAHDGTLAGLTVLGDLLICRATGHRTDAIRAIFEALWRLLRPLCLGRAATTPRVWAT